MNIWRGKLEFTAIKLKVSNSAPPARATELLAPFRLTNELICFYLDATNDV